MRQALAQHIASNHPEEQRLTSFCVSTRMTIGKSYSQPLDPVVPFLFRLAAGSLELEPIAPTSTRP